MYDIGMVVSLCLFCSEKAGLCFYAFSVLTEGIFYSRISQYENTLSGDAELSNVENESYIMAEMIEMMDYTEETENAFEETSTADEDSLKLFLRRIKSFIRRPMNCWRKCF